MLLGTYLAALLLTLIMSALSSCSETVFTSANLVLVSQKAANGDPRAKLAEKFIAKPESFLAAVLMSNNLWNVSMATIAQVLVSNYLVRTNFFQSLLAGRRLTGNFDELLTGVLVTSVGLIFCEILPKAIARIYADSLVLILARPLLWLYWILKAPIWLCTKTSRLLLKILHIKPTGKPRNITRDDLKVLPELLAEQHLLRGEVAAMLQHTLSMDHQPITQVMVPLAEIISLSSESTVADLEHLTALTGFSYFPVYEQRVNNIIGAVSLRRILGANKFTGLPGAKFGKTPITAYIDPRINYVPGTKNIRDMLKELRSQPIPLAIIVDEFGGTLGMVTPEDLVSEVVGGIYSARELLASASIKRIDANTFECSGRLLLRDLSEMLGMQLARKSYETAAGLVMELLGRIPSPGEEFTYYNWHIAVIEVSRHRIVRLRFTRLK